MNQELLQKKKEIIRRQVFICPSNLDDAKEIWAIAEQAIDDIAKAQREEAVNDYIKAATWPILEEHNDEYKENAKMFNEGLRQGKFAYNRLRLSNPNQ